MNAVRVLVTCRQMQNCIDEFRDRFDARGIELELPDIVQQPTEDELISIIGGFDGMIAGDDPLTEAVLEHASQMRIISKWGVGTDGIDKEAAARLGITVTNTPGVFGDEVADVAVGFMVMLARSLHMIDRSVREGGWRKVEGRSLTGKTLGIVGFGDIGRAVARRGAGFSMPVLAHDPDPSAFSADGPFAVEPTGLDHLLGRSDYVVLCCPLTVENHHLIDEQALALMPDGASLVNVARGPLVSEQALVEALASGRLAGVALDVFEDEPLPAHSRLREFEQTVFGSHNGSNTREAVLRASTRAVDNLLEGLEQ